MNATERKSTEPSLASMIPGTEKFLRDRETVRKGEAAIWGRRLGIDIRLPLLAVMEFMAMALLLSTMMFNIFLNREASALEFIAKEYPIIAGYPGIYFGCPVIAVIMWFALILDRRARQTLVRLTRKEPGRERSANRVWKIITALVVIGIVAVFFVFIVLLFVDPRAAMIPLVIVVIHMPLMMGLIALFYKLRYLVPVSLGLMVLQSLLYSNEFGDLLYLLAFSALAFTCLELSYSAIRFSVAYRDCHPRRDRCDHVLLDHLIGNYLGRLMIAVTAVTLLTALIFYSRSFISSLLPVSVTGGLEYNSHLFFFAPLLLFVLLLWIVKGLVRRFVPRRWLNSSGR